MSLGGNWASVTSSNTVAFFGNIKLTVAGIATSACYNVVLMMILNVITIVRFPRRLVTIRSGVEAIDMTEGDAIMLRSFDALSHDISMKFQVIGWNEILEQVYKVGKRCKDPGPA